MVELVEAFGDLTMDEQSPQQSHPTVEIPPVDPTLFNTVEPDEDAGMNAAVSVHYLIDDLSSIHGDDEEFGTLCPDCGFTIHDFYDRCLCGEDEDAPEMYYASYTVSVEAIH